MFGYKVIKKKDLECLYEELKKLHINIFELRERSVILKRSNGILNKALSEEIRKVELLEQTRNIPYHKYHIFYAKYKCEKCIHKDGNCKKLDFANRRVCIIPDEEYKEKGTQDEHQDNKSEA